MSLFLLFLLFVYEENIQENKYQGIIPTMEWASLKRSGFDVLFPFLLFRSDSWSFLYYETEPQTDLSTLNFPLQAWISFPNVEKRNLRLFPIILFVTLNNSLPCSLTAGIAVWRILTPCRAVKEAWMAKPPWPELSDVLESHFLTCTVLSPSAPTAFPPLSAHSCSAGRANLGLWRLQGKVR